eukprot:31349-Pelagococcus_subviridis.AAC.15
MPTNAQVRPAFTRDYPAGARGFRAPRQILSQISPSLPQGNSYSTPGGTNSNTGQSYKYSNTDGSFYYRNDNGARSHLARVHPPPRRHFFKISVVHIALPFPPQVPRTTATPAAPGITPRAGSEFASTGAGNTTLRSLTGLRCASTV